MNPVIFWTNQVIFRINPVIFSINPAIFEANPKPFFFTLKIHLKALKKIQNPNISDTPFDQRYLVHREALCPRCDIQTFKRTLS